MKYKALGERSHLLMLVILCIVAAWPFLRQAGLPQETDTELHVYRLAELARLVAGGEFYPRWAPNFYFGYGYPIFNYYAPLAYYLGLPLALLPGAGPVLATKAVFVLTYFAGAVGIYGFVGDWWGRGAAVVAATAYIFAPYLQYVDPHARGDLAEFLSLGLFPLSLWALSRLQVRVGAGTFLATVVTVALVILSHNLMALVFFALLCAWVVWQLAMQVQRSEGQFVAPALVDWFKERCAWMVAAIALAVGLSAFFWLPVALEQDAVNLSTLIGDGGHFDFRNHFLQLGQLLGPTRWLDWGATEPEFTLNLGIMQWLLALLGVGGVATGFARSRRQALFFVIAALVCVFLMMRPSTFIWQAVPMMPFLQFPWRLLGPSAALIAILCGVGAQSIASLLAQLGHLPLRLASGNANPKGHRGWHNYVHLDGWLPALFILAILLQSLPLSMVPPWSPQPWDTSAQAIMMIERQGRWLGTTSTADFVPRTVEVLPGPERAMIDQFLTGGTLDRVNRATLPEDVQVESETISALHTRYHITSEQDFLLRLFLFDFPGWEARLDGDVVKTILGRPEGFLVVPVPAGEHVVDVRFVETTVRRGAWILSGVALFSSLLLMWSLWRRGRQDRMPGAALRTEQEEFKRSATHLAAGPAIVVGSIFLLLFTLTQAFGWMHYRSRGTVAIPAQTDVFVNLDDRVALIGYDAPEVVSRGDPLEVTLYWRAQQEMDINFQVFVHLLDASGVPVSQSDKLNPGDFPTRRWPTDKYVRDLHILSIPETLPAGRYVLSTGMWVQDEGWRLPVLNAAGEQTGDSIRLTEITVK